LLANLSIELLDARVVPLFGFGAQRIIGKLVEFLLQTFVSPMLDIAIVTGNVGVVRFEFRLQSVVTPQLDVGRFEGRVRVGADDRNGEGHRFVEERRVIVAGFGKVPAGFGSYES
jgi:hypothetical protein